MLFSFIRLQLYFLHWWDIIPFTNGNCLLFFTHQMPRPSGQSRAQPEVVRSMPVGFSNRKWSSMSCSWSWSDMVVRGKYFPFRSSPSSPRASETIYKTMVLKCYSFDAWGEKKLENASCYLEKMTYCPLYILTCSRKWLDKGIFNHGWKETEPLCVCVCVCVCSPSRPGASLHDTWLEGGRTRGHYALFWSGTTWWTHLPAHRPSTVQTQKRIFKTNVLNLKKIL